MSPAGTAESSDVLIRLRTVEATGSKNSADISTHEEKCAGRYRMIIGMLLLSLAMSAGQHLPAFVSFLSMVRP